MRGRGGQGVEGSQVEGSQGAVALRSPLYSHGAHQENGYAVYLGRPREALSSNQLRALPAPPSDNTSHLPTEPFSRGAGFDSVYCQQVQTRVSGTSAQTARDDERWSAAAEAMAREDRGEHLAQDAPDGPHVHALGVLGAPQQDFGCAIPTCCHIVCQHLLPQTCTPHVSNNQRLGREEQQTRVWIGVASGA